MPGFDITHIGLIMALAFLVFGPERMRDITRTLRDTVAAFRRSSQGLPDLLSGNFSGILDENALGAAVQPLSGAGPDVCQPGEMTFAEHFAELRIRLFKAAIAIVVVAGVCFYFSNTILRVLKAPAGPGFEINAFGPMDGFAIRWKVALYSGLVLASPVWIYQIAAFLVPGLSQSERRFLIPSLVGVGVLFVLGVGFGYLLLAGMLRVMFHMYGTELNYLPNANQYISFVVFFMVACGVVFELPAVLLVLVRFGILQPDTLRRQRKIAYFALFVFAEIVTPVADPIVAPMIVMAPLVILYEGAILATRWVAPAGDKGQRVMSAP